MFTSNGPRLALLAVGLLLQARPASAQDLDPRAYIRMPVKMTTVITGFAYSKGGVVTDPTLPLEDLEASVQSTSVGIARTFNLFGLTAQGLVALPYSWAQASATVNGQRESITRSGFSDMRMRLSVLLLGGPAATVAKFKQTPKKTIVGVSLNMVLPVGQFFPDKLINLGTNRWAFRPEVAITQPIGKRWQIDAYSGIWLFTNNNSFYPGNSIRSQATLGAFQAHLSYNIKPQFWVALNSTYYTGGQSRVNQDYKDDRQSNSRIGFTAVIPTSRQNSLKIAVSKGVIVRVGQDFTTYSIGWQHSWIKGMKRKVRG